MRYPARRALITGGIYLAAVAGVQAQMVGAEAKTQEQVRMSGSGFATVERTGTAILLVGSGGDVKIQRGIGNVSNRSTLLLEWLMVVDSSLGLVFDQPVGAKGSEDDGWFSYEAGMHMRALKPIAAFEVKVIVFDIWRRFQMTLSFTQLEDLAAGQVKSFARSWGAFGESQLRSHLTSIGYVNRIRYADGTTVEADPLPVLKAAQRIQSTVTLQDLEPRQEPVRVYTPQT